jgi:tRNA1(Val) A37 N6-methylase TrmN6
MITDTTDDALLGGKLKFFQPRLGYRAAIDPVLLAASIEAKESTSVLDVGVGAGAAALCLAKRLHQVQITGIEIQSELANLARRNAKENGFSTRINIVHADICMPPTALTQGSFDHVMTNPPFLEKNHGRGSSDAAKLIATQESTVPLNAWLEFCLKMLRPKGTLTLVHRADRLDSILAALNQKAGEIVIYPLWPGAGNKPAKRILVRCKKGARTPMVVLPGLVLHQVDQAYTTIANEILWHGAGLDLSGRH